jgi:DNA-binding CsgD family transcriptional regulator
MGAGEPESGFGGDGAIGRDRVLARCDQMLGRLRSGRGGAIAVAGDPGIGKTRLLATARLRARAAGFPVLAATGAGASAAVAELTEPAAGGGAVVVLDDLHRSPPGMAPAIDELVHRAESTPVLVVLAYRPRQLHAAIGARLARADAAGGLWRCELAPLTPDEVAAMVGEGFDRAPAIAQASGSPQYLRILLERTAEAAGPLLNELAEVGPAGERLARVAACVAMAAARGRPERPSERAGRGEVDPIAPELVLAVCCDEVADPHGPDDGGTRLDRRTALAAIDALAAADVFRLDATGHGRPKLMFRHPVVTRVVYEHTPVGERREIHRRIDAALAERRAPPARRAPHLAVAGEPGRAEHIGILVRAARDVLAVDPGAAAGWAVAAGELAAPDDPRRVEARLLVAQAWQLTGELDESRRALHSVTPADALVLDGGRSALAISAARTERLLGNYPEAEALARDGLAEAGDGPEPRVGALLSELAEIDLYRGDHPGALRHLDTVVGVARRRDDRATEATARAGSAWAHASAGDLPAAIAAVASAARLIDGMSDAVLVENLNCLFLLSATEHLVDRHRDARRHAARGVGLCRRTGQVHLRTSLLMGLGNAQLLLGELEAALVTLDEAAHYAAREEATAMRSLIRVLRAHTRLWLDDGAADQAVAEADRAVADSTGLPWLFSIVVRSIAASVLGHAGHHGRARRRALEVGGGPDLHLLPAVRRTRLWEVLAVAELRDGDRTAAERYAELARSHLDEVPLPGCQVFIGRTQMLVHGARRDLVTTARETIGHARRAELWLTAGRTELAAAEAGLDAGWDTDPARAAWVAERLACARELADRCRSGRLAVQIRRAEGRQGRPPEPQWARALTRREREIARLASAGDTSADIARQLFVSVRTVDNHLGRIYRKLGVSGRIALARVVLVDEI